jgi:co-chaperonin GroES (HSP10)
MYNFLQVTKNVTTNEDLPKPMGYKILIAIPEISEQTEGGIYRPDALRKDEETATIIAQVVAMGDLCYQDIEKFPTGPWCKEGDWVVFRPYSGTRMKVHGQEMRLINDDTVECVVEDLNGFERAF